MFILFLAIATPSAKFNLLDFAANLDWNGNRNSGLIRISLNQSSCYAHSTLLYLALSIGARIC
jgi:hypothetical protein